MWSCIKNFFTYETTKSVVVKSWTIGIINRVVQLLIITYFIGWVWPHLWGVGGQVGVFTADPGDAELLLLRGRECLCVPLRFRMNSERKQSGVAFKSNQPLFIKRFSSRGVKRLNAEETKNIKNGTNLFLFKSVCRCRLENLQTFFCLFPLQNIRAVQQNPNILDLSEFLILWHYSDKNVSFQARLR